jgi:hypothetical protein
MAITNHERVGKAMELLNKWANQAAFSGDDACRALDSAGRLLTAVSAPQADEIERMKAEQLRIRFDEQARSEKHRHTPRPMTWKSAVNAVARRSIACATWSAGWNPRGGRLAPRKALRSSADGSSSR